MTTKEARLFFSKYNPIVKQDYSMEQLLLIKSWLEEHLPEYLDRLSALVNVDCGTSNKSGVDYVGRLFRTYLQEAGFELSEYPLAQYGDCCLASSRGNGKARILLIGHLDTVYPVGTAAKRPMRFENQHILGPGVGDMKAGLLTGLYAIRALQQVNFNNFAQIDFFLNTDEEIGSPASHLLYQPTAVLADAALVLESARMNGNIVSARKGDGDYRIQVLGRQAHAGVEIEKGANAILELSHCIQAISALNGRQPGTTVNVGLVGGGIRPNVVPDEAWAEFDVRFVTIADGLALDQAIRQAVSQPQIAGTHIEISGGIEKNPMERTAASAYLVDLIQGVGRQLGLSFQDVQTGGTSDGNYISEMGIPTLDGLGPIGGLDHSPDEYLEEKSILSRTALLAGFIIEIAAHRDQILHFKPHPE
jgi:glutamate carboxypeptidase